MSDFKANTANSISAAGGVTALNPDPLGGFKGAYF